MPLKKVSFTDARETLSSLIDEVQKSGRPIAITRHGKPAAVLMNMDAIEQKMKKLEKKPWMLRGSGTWVGDPADIDKEIRKIRREFSASSERRLKKVIKQLSDE